MSAPTLERAHSFKNTLQAESWLFRRRRDLRIGALIWGLQVIGFAYGLAFVLYSQGMGQGGDAAAAQLIPELLPENFFRTPLASLPLYGGPVMLVVGILFATSDYRWSTLSTILSRQSNRSAYFTGRAVMLLAWSGVIGVMTLVLAAISSSIVAIAHGSPAVWPSLGDIAAGLLATTFIAAAWALTGYGLGLLVRRSIIAMGIGLLWVLGLELAVRQLAAFVEAFEPLVPFLLSGATGALAVGMGNPGSGPAVTAGVVEGAGPGLGVVVLLAYPLALTTAALIAFRRRDVLD